MIRHTEGATGSSSIRKKKINKNKQSTRARRDVYYNVSPPVIYLFIRAVRDARRRRRRRAPRPVVTRSRALVQ